MGSKTLDLGSTLVAVEPSTLGDLVVGARLFFATFVLALAYALAVATRMAGHVGLGTAPRFGKD